jgi:hypothetical protein
VFGVLAFLSTRRGRRPAEVSRTDEA